MQYAQDFSILVVEDLEAVRELICLILEEDGYHVESASNGKEGLELFSTKHFDMVVTDLLMPVMSGSDMGEKMKRINKNIPIVLLTAWMMEYTESELQNKGIDYVVKKPFSEDQLRQLVRNELGTKEKQPISTHI
jgi:CheY-like chemotaxis protein